ncbi:phosphatase PAP2 family protein, partial [Vibrio parahaemolyticus]|nr:phosphatase PAP2 family protein [Vibrio parahaemolyticus]
ILLGVHFFTDVIIGALLGSLCGGLAIAMLGG